MTNAAELLVVGAALILFILLIKKKPAEKAALPGKRES
jgi:hypothetical protein